MCDEKFQKLLFWCQKVLPTVYDNSLSYYEVLCKTGDAINGIIDYLNDINLDNYATIPYVDQKYKENRGLIFATAETVRKESDKYSDNQNELLEKSLISKMSELREEVNARITAFEDGVEGDIYIFKRGIQAKLDVFMQEILDIVNNYPKPTECFNPTTGLIEPFCKCLNDIYNSLRYEAFTVTEFDTSAITVDYFDNSHITVMEFDTRGKTILTKKRCECIILNPFRGEFTSIEEAFKDCIAAFGNGVTVNVFDNLNLTVAGFDGKELTVHEFDFTNKITQ